MERDRVDPPISDHLVRLLLIGLFALTAFRNLRQPGLYGDEVWTAVQPAKLYLGLPGDDASPLRYVRLFGRSLPFMPGDYIGPVQGYVLFLAFVLFGLSATVLRVTTSLLGLAGVLCFHAFVRQHFGRLAAAAAALLLATDLNYLLLTRHDFGVISFCLFAQSAALWLLSRWARDRQWKHLFFGACALGLGLTQRINFLAFIVAVGVSFFLFCRTIRPTRREAFVAGAGFLVGAWPVLVFNALTRGAALAMEKQIAVTSSRASIPRSLSEVANWIQALPGALEDRIATARLLLDGSLVATFILGDQVKSASAIGGSLLGVGLLLALPVLMADFRFEPPSWRRSVLFFAGVFVLTFLFVALIPIASGPHHVAAMYPFPQLFVGLAIASLWRARPPSLIWRRVSRAAAVVMFVAVFVSSLELGLAFHARLARNGGSGNWTEAIEDLAHVLQREHSDQRVQIVDWGIADPLLVLGNGTIRSESRVWQLASSPDPVGELASLLRTPGQPLVLRSDSFAFSEKVHAAFREAIRREPELQPREKRFFQRNGALAFVLYEPRMEPVNALASDGPVIEQLIPSSTTADEPFNPQPSGEAAIAVRGSRFTRDSVVMFGSRELVTVYGGSNMLTALVPRDLYSRPGGLQVSVRNRTGTSGTMLFIVRPRQRDWLRSK